MARRYCPRTVIWGNALIQAVPRPAPKFERLVRRMNRSDWPQNYQPARRSRLDARCPLFPFWPKWVPSLFLRSTMAGSALTSHAAKPAARSLREYQNTVPSDSRSRFRVPQSFQRQACRFRSLLPQTGSSRRWPQGSRRLYRLGRRASRLLSSSFWKHRSVALSSYRWPHGRARLSKCC